MLNPRDRSLLFDSLRPPTGYDLDAAIGTTYSLDLLTLLAAPLAFTLFDWEDSEGHPTADPLALLEALRRYATKILVFCQAGEIKIPPRNQLLLPHLEHSVVEVHPPNDRGVFHAKIWLLRFVSADLPVRYRFLCLTRNLTFDRCWDTLLALDGELQDRRNAFAANHPLADFILALPDLAVRPLAQEAHARVTLLAEEVRKVRFELPEGFEQVGFHPLGVPGSRWPFSGRLDRVFIVSPFLSPGCLKRLTNQTTGHLLVSRPESLEELAPESLGAFTRVCILNDATDFQATDGSDTALDTPSAMAPPSGLHAKLYVADAGWNARVWTGSANATDAAFRQNVEFLVELQGKKSVCGIDALLGDSAERPRLGDLLQDFAISDRPRTADPLDHELEELVLATQRSLAIARLRAHVTPVSDTYRMAVRASVPCNVPSAVAVRCWPVTLREESALPLAGGQPLALDFGTVSLEAITPFLAFEVTAALQNKSLTRRFVITAELVGAPDNRLERLLLSILSDRARLLRFLLLLLAGSGLEAHRLLFTPQEAGVPQEQTPRVSEQHLFESLVGALDRDPAKLDQIARLMGDLTKTPEGAALLPDGFDLVWKPIWAARQRLAP